MPEGRGVVFKNGMRPVHPGEVLREDFMSPVDLGANALAKALHVPTPLICEVVRERRGLTADTALRLARYFDGDARSWLNFQSIYGWQIASQKKIEREIRPIADLKR